MFGLRFLRVAVLAAASALFHALPLLIVCVFVCYLNVDKIKTNERTDRRTGTRKKITNKK